MTKQTKDTRATLFKILDDSRAVMLGAEGGGAFMQPMAPQVDNDSDSPVIWFFTKSDTDLAVAASASPQAKLCIQEHADGLYACLNGQLATSRDKQVIDRFWSAGVGAWYEQGKDDPKLVLLRFTPFKASVWVNDAGVAKFGFEIAKANLVNSTPDLGYHEIIDF